jgi:hypothetical protein
MKFRLKQARQGKTISMGSAFSLILDEYGLKDTVILGKLKSCWIDFVGALLAVHSSPDKLYRDILYIAADHPIYSNEISLMKEIIISKISREFGPSAITDIRIQLNRKNSRYRNSR